MYIWIFFRLTFFLFFWKNQTEENILFKQKNKVFPQIYKLHLIFYQHLY